MGLWIYKNSLAPDEEKKIQAFVEGLADLTQKLADELYFIDSLTNTNAKFREWSEAAHEFQETGSEPDFIFARYGYAVEEYVNLSLLSKRIVPPRGYNVRLQVTHGQTRPDIVIINSESSVEIAWLDITSESSRGHILNKSGNWTNARSFVAELLYPDLDVYRITIGSTVASHAAPRIARAAKQMNSRLMRHLAECMDDTLNIVTIGNVVRERNFSHLACVVEANFGIKFVPNLKHPIIHSMLKMYVDLPGIKHLDKAEKWLTAYRREKPTTNKAKAMSYITDSYNLREKFALISDDEIDDSNDADSSGDYIPSESDTDDRDELDFEAYCDKLAEMGKSSGSSFDPDKFFNSDFIFR